MMNNKNNDCRLNRTRTAKFRSVLLERSDYLVATRRECGMSGTVQRDGYELPDFDARWRPAVSGDAAVDPIDMAIRAAELRDLCCAQLWLESHGDQQTPREAHLLRR